MAQNTPNTPLARVTAGFGTKNDLVAKVKDLASDELWLARLNEKKPWSAISNTKLLRLHALITDAKARFGSRDKLVEAIVAAEGRGKDGDYKKHFATWPLPRLMDALRSAEKRSGKASKKAAAKTARPAKAASSSAEAPANKGAKKGAVAAAPAKKGAATGAKKGSTAASPEKKGIPAKKGAAKKK